MSETPRATTIESGPPSGYEDVPHEAIRLRARRKAISRAMEAAGQVPSLTADMQMDLTRLLAARTEHIATSGIGARLSATAFLARATVSALTEFPNFNASYVGNTVLQWSPINLSIAVDSPGGLVVPVITDAQLLNVAELGARIADLAKRGREGDLTLEDLARGTFTLSNPGAIGPVLRAEALLNSPQVALLGFPSLKKVPVVVTSPDGGDEVAVRTVVCPSLTFDHRVLDGSDAIRLLDAIRHRVENWTLGDYLTSPATI